MKKIVSFLMFVSMICFGMPLTANAQETSNPVPITISGKVNMSLDYDGSKMLNNLSDTTFNLNSISVSNNELLMDGTVTYNNNSYPIRINSDLFKSTNSDNTIVGDAVDQTSNFDVAYLSIVKNVDKDKLLVNQSLANSNALQIYLLRKGTRELSMFEIPIDNYSLIQKAIDNCNTSQLLKIDKKSKEHWWINIFEPIVSTTSSNSNSISVDSLGSGKNDTEENTYTYYDGPANCYKYKIKLQAFADVDDDKTNTEVEDTFGLKIISSQYYYNGELQPDTDLLTVYNCIGTEVLSSTDGVANKNFIREARFGSKATQSSGGLTFTPYINFGNLINGSIEWSPIETSVSQEGSQTFNSLDKVSGFKVSYVAPLKKPLNNYSLVLLKHRVSSSTAQKISGAVFSYVIGFGVGDKLGSGSLTVACNYK